MKIGDRVKMSAAGRDEYGDWPNNPHDVEGEVSEPMEGEKEWISVNWDNGGWNEYLPEHLELIA